MYPKIIIGSLELGSTNVFHLLGAIGLLIYCWFTRKRYDITKPMAVFYSVILVGAGLVEFKIMGSIQTALIKIASDGELVLPISRRIIGVLIFQPIFIYLLSLITGDKFRKIADFIAAGTFICFVFAEKSLACLKGVATASPILTEYIVLYLKVRLFPFSFMNHCQQYRL